MQARRTTDTRKTLASIFAEAARDQDASGAKFSFFDLLCVGLGTTIGSGVFVLTGRALPVAGPAAALSWCLACAVCLLSSFSYMELSTRLPTKGSCYVFSYHGLGELAGVVGAVCLTLEYATSAAGVARTWSAKVYSMTGMWWVACFDGGAMHSARCNTAADYYFDPLAGLLTIACHLVLLMGLRMGKIVINAMTIAKIVLTMFIISAGFTCWTGNMFESVGTFAPMGFGGVVSASSMLYFGFVGFDEVCCMASRTANPARTMPRALFGTLIGVTLVSAVAQLSMAAMAPFAEGMLSVTFEGALSARGRWFMSWLTVTGELVLMPLVCLLGYLPQPELMAAMAEDGLLPQVFCKRDKNGTYFRGTLLVGGVSTVLAVGVPFAVLWNMIAIGLLFNFNLANASLINVRYGNGGALRDFRVDRAVWALLSLCCAASGGLNVGLIGPWLTGGELQFGWLAIGTATGLAAVGLLVWMRCSLTTMCDMDGPELFKTRFVPFVPAAAIFFNFFQLSQFSATDFMCFAMFLAVFLLAYTGYAFSNLSKCEDNMNLPTHGMDGRAHNGANARAGESSSIGAEARDVGGEFRCMSDGQPVSTSGRPGAAGAHGAGVDPLAGRGGPREP